MRRYTWLCLILFVFNAVLSATAAGEPFWAPRSFEFSRETHDHGKLAKFEYGVVRFVDVNRFSYVSKSAEVRGATVEATYFEQASTAEGCFRIYASFDTTRAMPATVSDIDQLFTLDKDQGEPQVIYSEEQQGIEFAKKALSSLFVYTDFELLYLKEDLSEIGFPANGVLAKSDGKLMYRSTESGKTKIYTFEKIEDRWGISRVESRESHSLPNDPPPTDDNLFTGPIEPRLRRQVFDAAVTSRSRDAAEIVSGLQAEYTSGQKVDSAARLQLFNVSLEPVSEPPVNYQIPDGHEVTLIDSPQIKAVYRGGKVEEIAGERSIAKPSASRFASGPYKLGGALLIVLAAAAAVYRLACRKNS